MNPSAEDIARAVDSVPAQTVFVLPNNKNIILASELAKDLSHRNIEIIPSTSVPQGITAALNFNNEESVDDNKSNMMASLDTVKTGSVTFAVRSTHIDGFKLKEGDIIGLDEKKIVAKGEGVQEVAVSTVESLLDENTMHVTLFYGNNVTEEEAQKVADEVTQKHPDLEVDIHNGGQPLYYYLISLE